MVRGFHERTGHQSGGGREKGGDAALGYSKGGFGTKLHLQCNPSGVPLAMLLSPGQRHESLFLEALVEAAERETGSEPEKLAGDKAYSAPRIRKWLTEKGIAPVIPYRKDELDRETYRERNVVERLIGSLEEMRAVATRADKLAKRFWRVRVSILPL
ncbi:MAG: IS5 family transposase [Fimbriimonas sp.]